MKKKYKSKLFIQEHCQEHDKHDCKSCKLVWLSRKEMEWLVNDIVNDILSQKGSVCEHRHKTQIAEDNDWNEDHFSVKHSEWLIWKSLYEKIK